MYITIYMNKYLCIIRFFVCCYVADEVDMSTLPPPLFGDDEVFSGKCIVFIRL